MLKERIVTTQISLYRRQRERPREEAVAVIQRWWRGRPFASLIRAYCRFNVSLHRLQRLSVDNVVELIHSRPLILVTSKLLHRVRRSYTTKNVLGRNRNAAKHFLTAYLLVAHSQEVLTTQTNQEKELILAGLAMIQSFETWSRKYFNPNGFLSLKTFIENLQVYYQAFEIWKRRDNEKTVTGMIDHYLELDRFWRTVKHQPNTVPYFEPYLNDNRKQLEKQIFKIGGREALTELFKVRQKDRDVRVERNHQGLKNHDNMKKAASTSLIKYDIYDWKSSILNVETDLKKLQLVRIDRQIAKILVGFTSEDMLTNEQLAHGLLLDPDFELTIAKGTDLEERVREVMIQGFFDTAREKFNKGEYAVWLPQLLDDIKDRLLELVSKWSPIHATINDVMDIDLITQQLMSGSYDIPKLMRFITEAMLDICAPVRDKAIRDVQRMTDLASVLQCLVGILQNMRLDLANYRVNLLRPLIREYGIEYERQKFDMALKAEMITLERTTKWIRESMASSEDRPNEPNRDPSTRFEVLYYKAILSTVFSMTVIHQENCPETLLLDVDRLYEYQNESQAITIVAALLMLSKNIVPEFRKNPALIAELRDRLFVLLKDPETILDNLTVQLIDSLSQMPNSPNRSLTSESQVLIRNMVDKTLSSQDPIYTLLSRRISEILFQHLSTGNFPQSAELISYGIEDVSAELQVLSNKLVTLVNHNREVYASYYNNIIHECMLQKS